MSSGMASINNGFTRENKHHTSRAPDRCGSYIAPIAPPSFGWRPGSERIVTYGQPHRMVCRFANGLKSLAVAKGDRVIIYMPLTIEGRVAMLACARLGVIHRAGMPAWVTPRCGTALSTQKRRSSLQDESASGRGKTVALKAIVDEAVDKLDVSRRSLASP